MNRPAMIDRLNRTIALIEQEADAGRPTRSIILALEDLGAIYQSTGSNNSLRYCGVSGNCTSSPLDGVLASWLRCARNRIARLEAA